MNESKSLEISFSLGMLFAAGVQYSRIAKDKAPSKKPEKWITVNGSHIPLDKEGRPTSKLGNKIIGNKPAERRTFPNSGRDLTNAKPKKSPEYYLQKNGGNYRKAIVDFYDNELRGGYVTTKLEIDGKEVSVKVVFDGKGRHEFQKFSKDFDEVLAILPYITEVIKNGSYHGRKEEKNHLPQLAFHTKMRRVVANGKRILVAVDIGEGAEQNFHAYSVNREGIRSFAKKKELFQERMRLRATKKKIGHDSALLLPSKDSVTGLRRTSESNDRFANAIITQDSEVINMSFLGLRIL